MYVYGSSSNTSTSVLKDAWEDYGSDPLLCIRLSGLSGVAAAQRKLEEDERVKSNANKSLMLSEAAAQQQVEKDEDAKSQALIARRLEIEKFEAEQIAETALRKKLSVIARRKRYNDKQKALKNKAKDTAFTSRFGAFCDEESDNESDNESDDEAVEETADLEGIGDNFGDDSENALEVQSEASEVSDDDSEAIEEGPDDTFDEIPWEAEAASHFQLPAPPSRLLQSSG